MSHKKASDEQLLEAYNRLNSVWQVAKEVGMCGQVVWRRLKKLGLHDNDKWTEDEIQKLRDTYACGSKYVELDKLSLSLGKLKSNICRKARRLGFTNQKRGKSSEAIYKSAAKMKIWLAENGHPRGAYKPLGSHKRICFVCGVVFDIYPSSRDKCCSKRCATIYSAQMRIQKGQGYARTGRRVDLNGQYFRSSYEANYARYLNHFKVLLGVEKWDYEPDSFPLVRDIAPFVYTPDFKVTFVDGHMEYHEVKGWDYPKGQIARQVFQEQYPYLTLILKGSDWFYNIKAQKIDKSIPNWEYPFGRKRKQIKEVLNG